MTMLLPSVASTFRGCHACVFKPARTAQTSRKRPRAAVAEQHARLPDDAGNPDLQEKLMNVIRVQIGQEKVKDFVREESEKLRQAAEEVGLIFASFDMIVYHASPKTVGVANVIRQSSVC